MTPIQQHEQALRAMMERAGLSSAVRVGMIAGQPGGNDWTVPALLLSESDPDLYVASYGVPGSRKPIAEASHPDPRIALRHCLEMAGLMEDRPPRDDGELVRWLTERHGEGVRMGHVTAWARTGIRMFHGESTPWVRGDGESFEARELGAILWCAERWTEAQP